jgi:light-regulated signal transduction histidine kinase (bacteriophytochrome)
VSEYSELENTAKHVPEDALKDALEKCESEAIHLVHAIQPHGYLLAVDDCGVIRLASDNIEHVCATPFEQVLGQPLANLLGEQASQSLRLAANSLQPGQVATFRLMIDGCTSRHTTNARAHWADGLLVIELEIDRSSAFFSTLPPLPEAANDIDFPGSALIRETLRCLELEDNVLSSCRWVAQYIWQLTGFDRVMIYRFSENWDGEVIAESGSGVLQSKLGHHFPAADIPAQARALYAKNRIRVLSDTEAPSVPLIPALNPLTGRPLDMSNSVLRSISPIHIRYLRNMAVGASLSVSLMQGGRLWGLIACHHATPRLVPFPIRDTAEIIGRMASFKLDSLENRRSQDWLAKLHATQLRLTDVIRSAQSVEALSGVLQTEVLPLIGASAGLLVIGEQHFRVGDLPAPEALAALLTWLRDTQAQECVFSTNFLARDFPPAEKFSASGAGLLAVALGAGWKDFLLCFRPEIVRDIVWAGNPAKQLSHDASGVRLNPRHSFESWVETARHRSLPWDRFALDALTAVSHSLQAVIAEKSLQAVEQRIHRLKDEFVTNISHEMRTPLHAILSFTSIAFQRLQGPPEKLATYLTRIQTSGQRLHALVEDLLILTRLQARMVTVNARPTNVRSILGACVGQFNAKAQEKNLQVDIRLNTECFDACVAPDLIAKVIDKLLSNAGNFSPTGGRIRARLSDGWLMGKTPCSAPDEALRIEILDEGPGIPAEELESIFDKFSQSTRTQTGAGGTGLGLSICREIMKLHGGSIHAENRVTGGACLVCLIPRSARQSLLDA